MPYLNTADWTEFLRQFPGAHVLQTAAWGDLKAGFGWQVVRVRAGASGAQLLFRRVAPGVTFAYLPKGPLGDDWEALIPEIDTACRARKAAFLKIEPDVWQSPSGGPLPAPPPGFRGSPHAIQPPRTLVVDLTLSGEQILARMKQKTRYNIRLARRKHVIVQPSDDLDTFTRLMQVTAQRDNFGVHSPAYYRRAYELFAPQGGCVMLIAEYDGEPLAALMAFLHGERAWYFYGASSDRHRNRMPAYLLQWEAIEWARARGCLSYDLWGVPDHEELYLEENFAQRSDGLWGVYRFKRGFGGELKRSAGPWDRVYNPILYRMYQWWIGRTHA